MKHILLLTLFLLATRPLVAEPVTALVFSPDGKTLLSGGYRNVTVRPVSGPGTPHRLSFALSQIHTLAFSPDGKTLAIGGGTPGERGIVCLAQWPERRITTTLRDHSDLVTALAFSPDGKTLATASADKTVALRSFPPSEKTKPRLKFTAHAGPTLAVAFSPDSKTLLTGGADRALKVWEAATGKLLHSLNNHTGMVHCLAIRPLARTSDIPSDTRHPTPATRSLWQCASGSEDGTARVWQPEIGRMVRIVRGGEGAILAIVYTPDGKTLLTAGTEGSIRVVDADSDTVLRTWRGSKGWVNCLAVSPNGKTIASGDSSGQIRFWPLEPMPRQADVK
jgi:WD40 repeat protein